MTRDLPVLLMTYEVADLLGVSPKTVTRWQREGKLDAVRTLGGHRRYYRDQVLSLLEEATSDREV